MNDKYICVPLLSDGKYYYKIRDFAIDREADVEKIKDKVISCLVQLTSGQLSCSVMSDSLQLREPQHTRPPFHHQLLESTQTHVD